MYGKWGVSRDGGLSIPPPIFFLRHQKENAPRPVEKKKCFGGSVRASADLLPPAREGWLSLAAVRDGNAFPLGSFKPGEVPDTLCADFTRKGYAASVSGKAANGCAAAAAGLPLRDKGRHIGRPLYVGGSYLPQERTCVSARWKGPSRAMERQRVQEQGPCDDHPDDCSAEHAAQERDKRTVRREPAGD